MDPSIVGIELRCLLYIAKINDISKTLNRLKATPNLVSSKHRQGIKRRRNKFRRLTQAKTPIKAKRHILTQKAAPSYYFWFHYWVELLVVRFADEFSTKK